MGDGAVVVVVSSPEPGGDDGSESGTLGEEGDGSDDGDAEGDDSDAGLDGEAGDSEGAGDDSDTVVVTTSEGSPSVCAIAGEATAVRIKALASSAPANRRIGYRKVQLPK
ncbi:hypothetical protein FHU38_000727 [Saccharomonospora amisosensis]|uniref:Uncharacterized protein n=1 Tax=Saccharomonospora amisosensis TaxID=1128677 RepID=A0A7X5ULU0_9PSEU|nr:hypothetical protein [Saccharomonospora amisosensis]NIJ10383.1 hypothetical protein [Saccharomonospora amisosensis]